MAHAQKPDIVFRAKRTSPFKSAGASVQSTAGSRGVRISGSNAGYTVLRGSVKGTGYPLHSPVFPLHFPYRASPCAITFQLESTELERERSKAKTKCKLLVTYELRDNIAVRITFGTS